MKLLKKLFKDESGATAIEYGLIAALLSVAIIIALTFVSGQLNSSYNKIGDALEGANSSGS